jgi:hypothetical protein
MAITLYSGTPGSYKSYHATTEILKWLSWDRNVIANFPINASKYYKKPKGSFIFVRNTDLTVDYLLAHHKKYHKPSRNAQTLVVIDEASIPFNSRQFDRKDRMEWVNFFANHRHFNFDVILIAQEDRMLDRQIRGLLEYDYKFRAIKNMNLAMMITSILCGGLYHIVEYWYPCKMKVTTHLCKFNKKKASCYDTMALFNLDDTKIKAVPTAPGSPSSATIDRDKLRARLQQAKRGVQNAS